MKRIAAILLCLCALFATVSCNVVSRKESTSTVEKETLTSPATGETTEKELSAYMLINGEKKVPDYVLEIDGVKIGYSEFRYNYLLEKQAILDKLTLEEAAEYWTEETEKKLLDTVIENIRNDQSILQFAAKNNIALTEDEISQIQKEIQQAKDAYGEETLLKNLQSMNIADFEFYQLLVERTNLINNSVAQFFYGENGTRVWDDQKLESYVQDNFKCSFEEFYQKTYLRAKHILVMFEEGEDTKSHEKSLASANSIYEKLQNGADFDAMIKEFNEDPGMTSNPDGYVFAEGTMVDEFYEGTKALEENKYSKPVMTSYGFHIILRLPLTEEGKETAKEELLFGNNSTAGAYQKDFSEYTQQLSDEFKPTITLNPDIKDSINHDSIF